MKTEKNIKDILRLLDNHYPTATKCYLNYETCWQLLIATILSAQCTDERVNIVTKDLFNKYGTLADFAGADLVELENDIKSTGFFRNKAKNIINCTRMILEKYDGEVPSDIDELVKLPGVGRKTANVVRGHIFNIPSIVVDTHVNRLSNRIGLVNTSDPVKVEFELYKILPEDRWIIYNTQMIAHGRAICKSQNPKCDICFFRHERLCDYSGKNTRSNDSIKKISST